MKKRVKKPTAAQIAQAGQMVVAHMTEHPQRLSPMEIRSLLRHYVQYIVQRDTRHQKKKKTLKKKKTSKC
jgi:hypothetical protein